MDSSVNILVVDDYPANLLALEGLLAPLEYNLVLARSGVEALKRALEVDFSLILLDVQMPGMDGFETARYLSQHERTRHTPVIFLTAMNRETAHVSHGYEVGAIDYIVKPIDPVILQAKVRAIVEGYVKRIKKQEGLLLERDRLVEAEVRRRAEAEVVLHAREETIATVVHDLRTPLGAIALGAGALLRTIPTGSNFESARRYVERIRHAGTQMDALVGDLLDVAQMEAGSFSLSLASEAPRTLIADAIELLDLAAQKRTIELAADVQDGCPNVLCDRRRILQVFSNLAGNALKFSPKGSQVRLRAQMANQAVEFSVSDEGDGIEAQQLDHIFERYWQGSPRKTQGVGIGLAIVKGIVECHGSSVRVRSAPGRGTTFTFSLGVAPGAFEATA